MKKRLLKIAKEYMLEKEINHRNEYEKVINATCLVSISDIKGRIVYTNKEFCMNFWL